MPKRPFYEVVLNKIGTRVPFVLVSQAAEYELRELGEVLTLSVLPEDKKSEIILRLQRFVSKLPPVGDEAKARNFLQELIEKISSEEK